MQANRGRRYGRFMILASAVALGLVGVGWAPTRNLAGSDGIPAMLAGCAIGLLSAAIAAGAIVASPGDTPNARMQRALLAMGVRIGVVALTGAAAVLSGRFAQAPLLFWIATSYVVLLPLEVKLAIALD